MTGEKKMAQVNGVQMATRGPGSETREPGRGGRRRVRRLLTRTRAAGRDAGMVTSEYAMGLVAAVGFAGVLYKVLTSAWAHSLLQHMVGRALHV